MTSFHDTDAGAAFVMTGDTRETSPEIMRAIAFHARNIGEAESLWNGDGFGRTCTPVDLWETATGNGRIDAESLVWGESGDQWAYAIGAAEWVYAIGAAEKPQSDD